MVYKNAQKIWSTVTYKEYRDQVHEMVKVFIKLGLEPHHTVSVLALNSPEWFVSELATIHAGGIITGVYTTNSAEFVKHVLESSRINIVVDLLHQVPVATLKAVIQTTAPYTQYVKREDDYYDVEEEFKTRLANNVISKCCLVYTSGTVGNPKGAMMSHDSVTWNSYSIGIGITSVRSDSIRHATARRWWYRSCR